MLTMFSHGVISHFVFEILRLLQTLVDNKQTGTAVSVSVGATVPVSGRQLVELVLLYQ